MQSWTNNSTSMSSIEKADVLSEQAIAVTRTTAGREQNVNRTGANVGPSPFTPEDKGADKKTAAAMFCPDSEFVHIGVHTGAMAMVMQ